MVKGIHILVLALQATMFYNAAAPVIYKTDNGTISFRSDAPLELIKASSNKLEGLFDTDTKKFAFRIKVSSFEGFNNDLQKEHFNENYMESDKYPYATFSGKIIEDIEYNKPGTYSIRAKGNLSVHGVEQERIIKVDLVVKEKAVSAKSGFTVMLSDHNITIPKVVHEKLASEIKVEVKAEFARH